jgi:hypothetical protein
MKIVIVLPGTLSRLADIGEDGLKACYKASDTKEIETVGKVFHNSKWYLLIPQEKLNGK